MLFKRRMLGLFNDLDEILTMITMKRSHAAVLSAKITYRQEEMRVRMQNDDSVRPDPSAMHSGGIGNVLSGTACGCTAIRAEITTSVA